MTWKNYLIRPGLRSSDERTIVAPYAFPNFAEALLGWTHLTLAPEISGDEGRPDFVPVDAVTHPFVFETKGTEGIHTVGHPNEHDEQVERYLRLGGPRIRRVVLTNLHGIRVYSLVAGGLHQDYRIDLNHLVTVTHDHDHDQHAVDFLRFLEEFRFVSLSDAEKVERIRTASAWSSFEATNSAWVVNRIGSVVSKLSADAGLKLDPDLVGWAKLATGNEAIARNELQTLEMRAGAKDANVQGSVVDYLTATSQTARDAIAQFVQNTAFYSMTRLLLVRVWEDSGLVKELLMDGGFDRIYGALGDLRRVVSAAFVEASGYYPSLFTHTNPYTWYAPDEHVLVDVLYDLANTYLGELTDDILGDVYQQQLARVDRKRLGQYYTPRGVIDLILDEVHPTPADPGNDAVGIPRVYDFATGSGGFLVKQAHREKARLVDLLDKGATVSVHDVVQQMADSLVGTEISQFSAYLTEVNLLLQMSDLLKREPSLKVPHLAIHRHDSLVLHNPTASIKTSSPPPSSLERLHDPAQFDSWFDAVFGNPPYVGEKTSAQRQADLKRDHPYWQDFSQSHQDYLYFFLILGISKLRQGGRFGFITTEYWLNAKGAAPLREFIAKHCRIERLYLFRNLTLFPDAPGQHNLVIVGERLTDPANDDAIKTRKGPAPKPRVTIYRGAPRSLTADERADLFKTMRTARDGSKAKHIDTFTSQLDPRALGGNSWAEVIMTKAELKRRLAIKSYPRQVAYESTEGIVAPPQRLTEKEAGKVTSAVEARFRAAIGGLGIYVLTAHEHAELAAKGLTPEETAALKPIINTRHIYPYAAVLPPDHDWLIWLPYRRNRAFPANMPTIRHHLNQFKPLLEEKVRDYKASRPWWSIHNPRTGFVDQHTGTSDWEDMAATSRWGDRKLLTGLLPHNSLPLSGMHLIAPEDAHVEAAYLVGLINSDPVRALEDAIAPGSFSQDDLKDLGLPRFPGPDVRRITAITKRIANRVAAIITDLATHFPSLRDALRADPALSIPFDDAWRPSIAGGTPTATLDSATWITIEPTSTLRGRITGMKIHEDLLGVHVKVTAEHGHVLLTPEPDDTRTLQAVADFCAGSLGEDIRAFLKERPIHLDQPAFMRHHSDDIATKNRVLTAYANDRQEINDIVTTHVH